MPLKYLTLVASVLYLGFAKSQLLSIVNVFGLLTGNLPVFRYSLAWYLFAGFAVASTVLWGRLYCGRVCAYGALTQLLDRIVPATLRVNVPRRMEQRASLIKYGILAGLVAYFLVTRDPSIYRYVEPFWMFGGQATTAMWIGLGVLLVATVFVRNLYCRFLCPAWRRTWLAVDDLGVSHQTVGRVQHLPHLREDMRMGRDPRSAHPDDRVRPL